MLRHGTVPAHVWCNSRLLDIPCFWIDWLHTSFFFGFTGCSLFVHLVWNVWYFSFVPRKGLLWNDLTNARNSLKKKNFKLRSQMLGHRLYYLRLHKELESQRTRKSKSRKSYLPKYSSNEKRNSNYRNNFCVVLNLIPIIYNNIHERRLPNFARAPSLYLSVCSVVIEVIENIIS